MQTIEKYYCQDCKNWIEIAIISYFQNNTKKINNYPFFMKYGFSLLSKRFKKFIEKTRYFSNGVPYEIDTQYEVIENNQKISRLIHGNNQIQSNKYDNVYFVIYKIDNGVLLEYYENDHYMHDINFYCINVLEKWIRNN